VKLGRTRLTLMRQERRICTHCGRELVGKVLDTIYERGPAVLVDASRQIMMTRRENNCLWFCVDCRLAGHDGSKTRFTTRRKEGKRHGKASKRHQG